MSRRPHKRPKTSAKLKSVPKSERTGNGGVKPPKETQFAKGFDPRRGRGDTARAIVCNTINDIYVRKLTSQQLREMTNNADLPEHARQAAQIILHSRRATTLADFSEFLDGTKTLLQLKDEGVDVAMVKAVTKGRDGAVRIELFADRGENFDRIMEHTGISPSELEKYRRIDNGLITERFESVEIVVPGLPNTRSATSKPSN